MLKSGTSGAMLYKFSLVNMFKDAPPFTVNNMVPPEFKSILINQDINYGPLNLLPEDNLSIGGFVAAPISDKVCLCVCI